ncbi:PEP-CTERM system histidine kinase PrsK [Aestuariibacter sp. AA17]|uniref:histidine kinase n=1 Tax=Fluctibacter corallii TaxID=2984329 RepID=A0ABT3ABT7_9ALTE|nr:XrtA/PEP-CTERM system histidine kinase PrsK [Aestuariibacter sp. AA17]MCV2886113.1 PEP-CTERM system histidine kinase PrsK [Aestuariibacter sp. AA17]
MIADIGFALSGIGFFLLTLLLLTVRKAGLAKHLLLLASLVTMVWSFSHVSFFFGTITHTHYLRMDIIKQIVWIVFLLGCVKDNFTSLTQVLLRPFSLIMLAPSLLSFALPFIYPNQISWLYLLQTIIALQILVLLELIFRQAGENRWEYKPLILFVGATNLLEFVSYANATMVGHIDPPYIAAKGFVYAALVPLLVLAIRRIKHWGVDIFVSREVVLHSSLIMVAGAYLFIMALAGYAVKYFGGEWGSTVQIVLVVLSLVLLASLFLSNSFRIKIKVFITKHFFANQFDYRIEWVKLTQALQSSEEGISGVYDSALKGLINAIKYESGILVKTSNQRFTPVAYTHDNRLSSSDIKLLQTLSDYFAEKNWIIDIEELRYKPFIYEGLKVNHALLNQCEFKLVLPIFQNGALWGMAILKDADNSPNLNWEVRDYLTAVVAQVSSFVFHYEASKEVAENAQFAAFNRMSAFVLHDLKNVMAQIDLILCNAEQHKHNPEFIDDTFETLEHTKARMTKMLRQLTEKKEIKEQRDSLCLASSIINHVVDSKCSTMSPIPEVNLIEELQIVIDEEKFSNVMYHLIDNAQQATRDDGFVVIEIDKSLNNKHLIIKVIDNGEGMSESFIHNRLFKPFDTTKGNAGMGIGAYDAKNFIEKAGGQLEVFSEVGVGTTFTLTLPVE